jgi:uncharacterized phage protein (TIGR01671 family)
MRETKFEAWSKHYRTMYDSRHVYKICQSQDVEFPDDVREDWKAGSVLVGHCWEIEEGIIPIWLGPEDVVLRQYTGLKDKNGKEIYEGDIVRCRASVYGSDEEKDIHEVRWGSFSDCCVEGETWILGPDAYKKGAIFQPAIWYYWGEKVEHNQLEVIGNIYENPELLKGETCS